MSRALVDYARALMIDPKGFELRVTTPMLIWTYASAAAGKDLPLTTNPSGLKGKRPVDGQSVVFEVQKNNHKLNPFSFGVTIGRVDSNDVPLEDGSVSRFHAYLQETDAGWIVCDAESKNGTFIREQRLQPNVKTPLEDGVVIKFGDVPLQFLLPASFITRLQLLQK
ncbi:MAG: FHA domain-containing protein [Myxococcaceae bacterium]